MTHPFSGPNQQSLSGPSNKPQLSAARLSRPQQSAWATLPQQQGGEKGLPPISTATTSTSNRANSSSSPLRPLLSPNNSNFPTLQSATASIRQAASRNSSVSSISSPFSPLQSGTQQLSSSQLLPSNRSRTITSSEPSQLASSTAASPSTSQGGGGGGGAAAGSNSNSGGGNSSSGGGGSTGGGGSLKLARASPSLTQPAIGSPSINPTQMQGSGQSLSKITIAQVFLLLSTIKEDKDKAKWESQADQIRKVSQLYAITKYKIC